jgi:branched-chain amino acid transport system permease protein
LAIMGLNLVTGYSGQISIGHSAFFGVGAYTTSILVADYGWPFILTLPVAALFGFIAGVAIGLPALKIRGLYLSLVTLGLALAFPSIVKMEQLAELTGAANGKTLGAGDAGKFAWNPPGWMPDSATVNDWIFLTCVLVALVMFLLASNLVRSRTGRAVQAMRDNEVGAAVSGVHPAWHKVNSFAFSAAYAAVAGGCFSLSAGTIAPDTFGLNRSIEFVAGLVIGGVATIIGPLIGGIVVEFLPYLSFEFLPGPEAGILYGIILVLLVFVMPGGIVAGFRMVRAKFVQVIPRLPTSTAQPVTAEPVASGVGE